MSSVDSREEKQRHHLYIYDYLISEYRYPKQHRIAGRFGDCEKRDYFQFLRSQVAWGYSSLYSVRMHEAKSHERLVWFNSKAFEYVIREICFLVVSTPQKNLVG